MTIQSADCRVDLATGRLEGECIQRSEKPLYKLAGIFADTAAFEAMDGAEIVYRVEMHAAVADGTAGGLFFGTSYVNPGKVGDEYFMTQGHCHAKAECAEYYWCVSGEGLLLLADEAGARAERMQKGTVHYIPGHTAHRLVNTGSAVLTVGACWGSDAGHDYTIAQSGFPVRVVDRGEPTVIAAESGGGK